MTYPLAQIAGAAGGRLEGPAPDAPIRNLLIDSRKWSGAADTLFIALKGPRHDAHHFVADLYERGQRFFLLSADYPAGKLPGATLIRVKDTLAALQQLAAWHRSRFHYPVVGITGSNGKTIVKEWLFQLLRMEEEVVRSPRSYNSQVGVPLSVWLMEDRHTLGLFEAGISLPGEMLRLERILRPQIGILTNLGDAHDEGFASREQKLMEKLQLFRHARRVICPAHLPLAVRTLTDWGVSVLRWSFEGPAELTVLRQATVAPGKSRLEAEWAGAPLVLDLPFTDRASIENALTCCLFLLSHGLSPDTVARRLSQLEPVAMRLELLQGERGCRLINDSYNSDLTSLAIALDFMQQQGRAGRKTVILSDIEQSRSEPEALYRQVGQLLREKKVDRLIGVGIEIPELRRHLPPDLPSDFYTHTSDLLAKLDRLDFREETVLVKGARSFGFERISRRLEKKVQQAVLEVNLSAMARNLTLFQRRLRAGTRLMAMVKAQAYGSGSEEVARMLEYHKVDYLAVAYTDEGVQLRRAGLQLPIMVLNPDTDDWDLLYQYWLEPEIYSLPLLRSYLQFSEGFSERLPVHLKIETGMGRFGFSGGELPEVNRLLREGPGIPVASVFSHLAAAEDPAEDDFSHRQAAAFVSAGQAVADALGYQPPRHLLNTAGILRFPQYQFEMVRLGVGLFGVDPGGRKDLGLEPAISFKARIAQIREVRPGDTVGYGRRGVVRRKGRVAIVRAGYADGLLRAAGNGRFSLLLRGRPAPIIGNVCMDVCMLDVTDQPEVEVGEEVLIFGPEWPIESLAATFDTIPYEVLTHISGRVKRLYLQE